MPGVAFVMKQFQGRESCNREDRKLSSVRFCVRSIVLLGERENADSWGSDEMRDHAWDGTSITGKKDSSTLDTTRKSK